MDHTPLRIALLFACLLIGRDHCCAQNQTTHGHVNKAVLDKLTAPAGTLLYDGAAVGSGGTVTSVSVTTANGVSGSVATATTTPAITLILGAITPTTVNGLTISSTTGVLTIPNGVTFTGPSVSGTAAILGANTFTGAQTLPQANFGGTTSSFAGIKQQSGLGTARLYVTLADGSNGSFIGARGFELYTNNAAQAAGTRSGNWADNGSGPLLSMSSVGVIKWTSNSSDGTGTADTFLFRGGAATVELGEDHATTPTSQTIKAHDVTTGTGANLILKGGTGSVANGNVNIQGNVTLDKTITAGGTTGAQTINKTTGSVNFAAAATSLVVTNSLCTTSSVILCTVGSNDATMKSAAAVAGSGSFTIHSNAAATAETIVYFLIVN